MAANPNTGKTTSLYMRLLVGGVNLSGNMRSFSGMGMESGELDATAWTDGVAQALPGRSTIMLDGFTALFDNKIAATGATPVNAGSHVALSGLGTNYVSAFIGIREAPSHGVPTFSSGFETGGYTVGANDAEALLVNASFRSTAALTQSAKVWGVTLAFGNEVSASGSQTSVNNGASSSGGYVAFLHLEQTTTAMASNNWSFFLEHSANDSAWATLGTFSANGSSITADRLAAAGTVNQYVRLSYTRTAGVARPWVSFIRL